ncbi:MAG: hypothetical protein ACR2NQ_02560 [Thermodesulfobacteriota bacterium]
MRAWAILLAGFACLWLAVFVAAPRLAKLIPLFEQMAQAAEERNIDASAYFYSELEISYEAERLIGDAVKSVRKPEPEDGGF